MSSCSTRAVAYIVKACVYALLDVIIIEVVFCASRQAAHNCMQQESRWRH